VAVATGGRDGWVAVATGGRVRRRRPGWQRHRRTVEFADMAGFALMVVSGNTHGLRDALIFRSVLEHCAGVELAHDLSLYLLPRCLAWLDWRTACRLQCEAPRSKLFFAH
jgi:hypothetical protein